jgi:hypothetical protein
MVSSIITHYVSKGTCPIKRHFVCPAKRESLVATARKPVVLYSKNNLAPLGGDINKMAFNWSFVRSSVV